MTHRLTVAMRPAASLFLLSVIAACGGGGGGGGGGGNPPPAINITSAALANGAVGAAYNQTIGVTGGTGARTFSISAGVLPGGLALNASNGVIAGTPSGPPGTADFTVMVVDSASPQQNDSQALSISINAVAIGRNDTVADATAVGNGTITASISPSGDPGTTFDPDEDYYAVTTTAASIVTVDINADVNGSPLDSVIEIVNASGSRLSTCVSPAFTSPCVHDDEILGEDLDSFLDIQVSGATTFFIHVVDFGSNARPDKLYDLVISGVN